MPLILEETFTPSALPHVVDYQGYTGAIYTGFVKEYAVNPPIPYAYAASRYNCSGSPCFSPANISFASLTCCPYGNFTVYVFGYSSTGVGQISVVQLSSSGLVYSVSNSFTRVPNELGFVYNIYQVAILFQGSNNPAAWCGQTADDPRSKVHLKLCIEYGYQPPSTYDPVTDRNNEFTTSFPQL